MGGKLWFIQLSGWPIFLIVVALAVGFAAVLTIVLTRASRYSVLQNALFAVIALTAIAFLGLLAALLATR